MIVITLLGTFFMMGGAKAWAYSDSAIRPSSCSKSWNHWNHYYKGGKFHAGYTMSDVTYLTRGFPPERYGLLFGRIYAWGGKVEKCLPNGISYGGEVAQSMKVTLTIKLTGKSLSEACESGVNVEVSRNPGVQFSHTCKLSPSAKVATYTLTAQCPTPIATCPITWENARFSLGPDAELNRRWWEVTAEIFEKPNFKGVSQKISAH